MAYLEFLEHNRNTAYDVRKRMKAHVLPQLGKIEVASFTGDKLRRWHADLARKPPACGASQARSKSTDLLPAMKFHSPSSCVSKSVSRPTQGCSQPRMARRQNAV